MSQISIAENDKIATNVLSFWLRISGDALQYGLVIGSTSACSARCLPRCLCSQPAPASCGGHDIGTNIGCTFRGRRCQKTSKHNFQQPQLPVAVTT